jgi:hypothetical protein
VQSLVAPVSVFISGKFATEILLRTTEKVDSTMAPSTLPLSPISPSNRSSSRSLTPAINPLDASALLDTLDQNRIASASNHGTSTASRRFDPIDFLNQHFETEQSLSQQLPSLRDAVGTRMQVLNDRISDALQKQNDTADSTRRHVQDPRPP